MRQSLVNHCISEIISSGLIGFKVENLFKTGARTQYRPADPWLRQTNILLVLHKSLLMNDCVRRYVNGDVKLPI